MLHRKCMTAGDKSKAPAPLWSAMWVQSHLSAQKKEQCLHREGKHLHPAALLLLAHVMHTIKTSLVCSNHVLPSRGFASIDRIGLWEIALPSFDVLYISLSKRFWPQQPEGAADNFCSVQHLSLPSREERNAMKFCQDYRLPLPIVKVWRLTNFKCWQKCINSPASITTWTSAVWLRHKKYQSVILCENCAWSKMCNVSNQYL